MENHEDRRIYDVLESKSAQDFFNFLSQVFGQMRTKILIVIGRYGEKGISAGRIAELLGVSRPRVSNQLKILRSRKLVHRTKQGREVIYRLNPDIIVIIADFFSRSAAQLQEEIKNYPLEDYLRRPRPKDPETKD
jgi:DNA-binding transcriptional ArsR family regulator